VDLWTAPAALGNDDGSATMRYLPRETTYSTTRACSVALSAKPRPGALLSSDDFGSSVERAGGCHPVYGDEVEEVWLPTVTASVSRDA
jgi:hypothetical protein